MSSFQNLWNVFERETANYISITDKINSQQFRAIVALGREALPEIKRLLRETSRAHILCCAVREILGEGPVIPENDRGATSNVRGRTPVREHYARWLEEKGY